MHFTTILAASLPVLGAFAAPGSSKCPTKTVTKTQTATVTKTHTTTVTPTSTCSGPITTPTSNGLTILSARSASPIHYLQMNAAGQRFYLGGEPSTYCPSQVGAACPPGNITALAGTCGLSVMVPGGQITYVTPQGEIGFTQAHSASYPAGSVTCPFTYSKECDASFGHITTNAFNATGLMACPTSDNRWQVFAAIPNAVVPSGKVSDCLGFSAIAADYDGPLAAWQYT